MFAGRVKFVSHLFSRTSAILKYFCPLQYLENHGFHIVASYITLNIVLLIQESEKENYEINILLITI